MTNQATTSLVVHLPDKSDIDRVVVMGDLSGLTPAERVEYYMRTCRSLSLNPLTKPFAYINLQGKLTLYATRACSDQLRSIRGVSIQIVDKKITEGLLSVHVRATDKDGRSDEDFGVVPINGTLQGEAGANLIMKAVTKAKRRVTLSICGLGMLDETEVETVPDAEYVEIDDAGEVRGVRPVPATKKKRVKGRSPDGRQTSYAAKLDGGDEKFKELLDKIRKSDGPVDCLAIWRGNLDLLKNMPTGWFKEIITPEFVLKMETHGLELEVDDYGWPILPEIEEQPQ